MVGEGKARSLKKKLANVFCRWPVSGECINMVMQQECP
jgi:hypothetical protein